MTEENKSTSTATTTATTSRSSMIPVGYYARVAKAEIRRVRQGFTRENVTSFFITLLWTIPLTLLIWVYAEQETAVSLSNVTVPLEIRISDPTKIAKLVKPSDGNIICEITGPRSNTDHFAVRTSTAPLVITIDSSARLGENSFSMLQTIANNVFFKDEGVSVKDCTPATLVVDVDKLDTRDVPVVPPPNLLSLQSATFTPSTVRITGPAHVLETMEKSGQLSVTADIEKLSVLGVPGQHLVDVPLIPPETASNITYDKNTVTATLTVKERDVIYDLSRVSVEVQAPTALMDAYKISPSEPFLASVTVKGPPDKIEQIKSHQIVPIAVLHVETYEDLQSHAPLPLEIRYLPEGVQLAPGANPTMSFKAVER